MTLDEQNVVPYICKQLNNFGMALKLAVTHAHARRMSIYLHVMHICT